MAINLDQLVSDMKTAASGILNADVSTFRGFSERQLKAIAQQTELVATGIANQTDLPRRLSNSSLDNLEDMVPFCQNFFGAANGHH